jgi:hypothetical protein
MKQTFDPDATATHTYAHRHSLTHAHTHARTHARTHTRMHTDALAGDTGDVERGKAVVIQLARVERTCAHEPLHHRQPSTQACRPQQAAKTIADGPDANDECA